MSRSCRTALLLVVMLLTMGVCAQASAQPYGSSEPESQAPMARRIGITSAVTLAATVATIGGGYGVGMAVANNCDAHYLSSALGCGISGGVAMLAMTLGVMPVALTLGSYLPHRALDGRGKWYAALAGAGVGMALGVGGLSAVLAVDDSRPAVLLGVAFGATLAASVPVLALELSHARQRKLERRSALTTAQRTQLVPVASALPQGAWLGIAGTL